MAATEAYVRLGGAIKSDQIVPIRPTLLIGLGGTGKEGLR